MNPALLLALAVSSPAPDTSVRLPRNGSIEIASRQSDVTVSVGNTDVVTIRGARADMEDGTLQINGDDRRSGRGDAIAITVPRWARIEVTTIAGNMTFNGSPESLHAASVSGLVRVTGGSGSVEVESVAGGVVISDFHGNRLSIDATGGDVDVSGATGAIEVENVNGDVTLRGIHSEKVSAASINGTVSFDGPLAPAGNYEFSSQNKDVTLVLPGDVSARVEVSTMNGQLNTQITATTTGMNGHAMPGSRNANRNTRRSHDDSEGEQSFTVVYGAGAARVTVDVFNGNLVVRRAGARP